MTAAWDALVAECHARRIKIGPITERPDGKWRCYLQRDDDLLTHAEEATIEDALRKALALVEDVPPATSFLD